MLRSSALSTLRARIAALEGTGREVVAGVVPLAVPAIDAVLPWGGLPRGCLHEIAPISADRAEAGAACGFAVAVLGRLAAAAERPVLWITRDDDPYAPGLAALGLPPQRLILVRPYKPAQVLWALEEGLRCAALAGVLAETWGIEPTAARRLQLAARASGGTALLLNRGAGAAPAMTRWRIAPAPSQAPAGEGVGAWRWQVDLLRCRGRAAAEDGRVAAWTVEWCDETRGLRVVAAAGDRSAEPRRSRRAG